jgi:hypothetical protein
MDHYSDSSEDPVFDLERVEPELTIYSDEMRNLIRTKTSNVLVW